MLHIKNNISLKPYNTFGIDVQASQYVSVTNLLELNTILTQHDKTPKLILGGGSNILLTQNFNGLVVHINIKGITVVNENKNHVYVKANAGENWHEFVLWCINNNYGGIENLSLIPGHVGTAPIQNIGAYGIELKDVFYSCEAMVLNTQELKTFTKKDCNFGYRNSIFKQEAKGQYIITSVTFKLSKHSHSLHLGYGAIASQLKAMNVTNPTIKDVSNAVIAIRQNKLPNPKLIGNSGSFFKNPVILKTQYNKLLANFSDMPNYAISDTEVKIPAGWLIEKAGFKGKNFGNCGVHKNQALVLINNGNAKGKDILKLSILIQNTIKRLFGICIEAEVNIM